MFSGLYREPSPSPVSTLMSIPGGTWLAGALVLGLFATVTTTFNREALPPQVTSADSGMVHLQSRVDSLALVVRQLHDSLVLAKTPSVPGKSEAGIHPPGPPSRGREQGDPPCPTATAGFAGPVAVPFRAIRYTAISGICYLAVWRPLDRTPRFSRLA
ncbi:MAG TPA: hypothetical protein VFU03_09160 [Gemmatimonadales bacterium]|nr:hypothetical protein [Gemmatimonadales bacterium]